MLRDHGYAWPSLRFSGGWLLYQVDFAALMNLLGVREISGLLCHSTTPTSHELPLGWPLLRMTTGKAREEWKWGGQA
jgi:hypothetical protein